MKCPPRTDGSITAPRSMGLSDIQGKDPTAGAEDPSLPKKRIFVVLLLISCVVLVALACVLWWVPYKGLGNIHTNLPLMVLDQSKSCVDGDGTKLCLGHGERSGQLGLNDQRGEDRT